MEGGANGLSPAENGHRAKEGARSDCGELSRHGDARGRSADGEETGIARHRADSTDGAGKSDIEEESTGAASLEGLGGATERAAQKEGSTVVAPGTAAAAPQTAAAAPGTAAAAAAAAAAVFEKGGGGGGRGGAGGESGGKEDACSAQDELKVEKKRTAEEVAELDMVLNEFTLQEGIDSIGMGWYQIVLLCICGSVYMSDGMEMLLLSFLIPAIEEEWKISALQKAMLGSVVFVGMMIGASMWGYCADKIGRRYTYGLVVIVTFVFGFASAFSPSYTVLLLTRGFTGIGVGGAHVAFSLFAEFLPTKGRGMYLVLFEIWWTAGTVSEASLAWVLYELGLGWRWLLALSAIPCGLVIFFYCFVPESFRYYLVRGNLSGAYESLKRLERFNKRGTLPDGVLRPLPPPSPKSGIKQLLSRQWRSITVMMWWMWFCISGCYYGIVLLTPEYFSTTLGGESSVYITVFITSAAELPAYIIVAVGVDYIGRKRSIAYLCLLCGLFTVLIAAPAGFVLQTCFAAGSRMAVAGAFAVIYLYSPEVYPTVIRGTGVGLCVASSRVGAAISPFVVELLVKWKDYLPLLVLGGAICSSGFLAFLLNKETASSAMVDIVEDDDDDDDHDSDDPHGGVHSVESEVRGDGAPTGDIEGQLR